MRIEKEIKLHCPSQDMSFFSKETILKTINNSLTALNIQIDDTTKAIHNDIYFDTETYLLYMTDVSLRFRQNENRLILKEKPSHSILSLCRTEWNRHLKKDDDIIKVANELFHMHINTGFVVPKLYVHLLRDSIFITTHCGQYQICVDEYTCVSEYHVNPQKYTEIEIETILSNRDRDLVLNQLITYIMDECKLINIFQSKYQIGISAYTRKEIYK